jgi:hypothetical protein
VNEIDDLKNVLAGLQEHGWLVQTIAWGAIAAGLSLKGYAGARAVALAWRCLRYCLGGGKAVEVVESPALAALRKELAGENLTYAPQTDEILHEGMHVKFETRPDVRGPIVSLKEVLVEGGSLLGTLTADERDEAEAIALDCRARLIERDRRNANLTAAAKLARVRQPEVLSLPPGLRVEARGDGGVCLVDASNSVVWRGPVTKPQTQPKGK